MELKKSEILQALEKEEQHFDLRRMDTNITIEYLESMAEKRFKPLLSKLKPLM